MHFQEKVCIRLIGPLLILLTIGFMASQALADGVGLVTAGQQSWHSNTSGILGVGDSSELFGIAFASGDFDDDGYDDLAIGARGDDVDGISFAGSVNVLYGSSSGLSASGDQRWNQNSSGIGGVAEQGDMFGSALAACDFDGDGYDDLAVGVPYEDIGTTVDSGMVAIIFGGPSGLSSSGYQGMYVNSSSTANYHYGFSLAAGDFDDDGRCDLAVGVPNATAEGNLLAGKVFVYLGTYAGLDESDPRELYVGCPGMAMGLTWPDWRFGYALAAGLINDNDDKADLVVGAPWADANDIDNGGGLYVFFGDSDGYASDLRVENIAPALLGNEQQSMSMFGASLAVGDIDDNGIGDILVGSYNRGLGQYDLLGAFNVIFLEGSNTLYPWYWIIPLNYPPTESYSGHSWGSRSDGMRFGKSIAVGDFTGNGIPDFAVGALGATVSYYGAGAVYEYIGGCGNQYLPAAAWFHQDTSGISV